MEYTETERRILAELINNRPVSPYNYIPIEIGLCWHKYFPLLWNSVLHPLLIVKKYRVLARYHEAQYSKRFQIVDSFDDLDCALLAFMGIVRRSSLVDQKLVLVGQCNNEVSVPGSPKMLPENGNLVFYKSKAVWSAEGENWEPCIEQVHDPAQPIPTHTPLFACYNKYQGIIHFYDGGLKRIRPSNSAEPLDLSFFDFGRRGPFVNFEENGNR
ncbi:MAG TPA: hypothetical protein VMH27_11665 [Puia sp.]|nr:hypothetical protein [Puia sp.]